ncbi:hypothetical protein LMH73_003635 [Vibrio splendidus]|nr:hypothetical protein [Vibrio splendidus]MCC4883328.1 hypothetical protein [Vibrio splendidus]
MKFENAAPFVSKEERIDMGTLFKMDRNTLGMVQRSNKLITQVLPQLGFTTKTTLSKDTNNSGFALGNKQPGRK